MYMNRHTGATRAPALLLLLVVLGAVALYLGSDAAQRTAWLARLNPVARAASADAAPLYRWRDNRGQVSYGTQPPTGVKAEVVSAANKMSVVPATAPATPAAPARHELPAGVTIQQLATERAIDQATR